ncbi:DUF2130 domain-containing protein [Nocardia terpenica]|uniref:DUF2130 domain-containing protein n=1 Tax=Nocardia terpenica TaxID=455432 RepID=UPI000308F575|nr:DUF2130 domain-containing protein [Nocardia terpenica]NQE90830.1 DUF2130 domain-containing protein [Nocardia terpenica]
MNCPQCGTDLGHALIRKLAEPQVEQVRIEYEQKLAAVADATAAEATAAANMRLEQQQQVQRHTEEKYQRLIDEKIAELAEKDEKLKLSQELEQNALTTQKRLETEQQEWELEKARMRNEITNQERARADRLVEERVKVEHDRIDQQYQTRIDQLEERAKRHDEQAALTAQAQKDLERTLAEKAHADVADEITALRAELARQREARQESETALRGEIGRKDIEFAEHSAELSAKLEAEAEREKAELRAEHRRQQRQQLTQQQSTEAELRGQIEEKAAEIAERDTQLEQAQEAARDALRERRQLKREKDSWVLEKEQLRDQIAAEERRLAERHAAAQYEAKIAVLEREKRGLSERVEEAHRLASAGARPQHEGLARQELFAEELRNRWPDDDIRVVKRGQKGADVIQTVWIGNIDCGAIVWECKWTQRFEPKWITKLTEDKTKHGGNVAVLVSAKLPDGVDGSTWMDGILVCDFTTAVHVAGAFRKAIIDSKWRELSDAAEHRDSTRVYKFVQSEAFAACLHRIITIARNGKREIELLENYVTRFRANWVKSQETVLNSVFTMVGQIEEAGVIMPGPLRGELPSAEHLALPAPDDHPAHTGDPDGPTELDTAA